ncbi:BlaI/MecI/CopY family transcriptional regulator [Rhodocytophaga aerolata]|uniref:BlaI/MecI/CopY family transcriptional regulator n=1 Tax=Rhodocytophaga aerolata TaxID=455078 RepID=A0ABT8R3C9_9BACT|nr:BlaI/MecI/CopY family transcriptional regulator [Rhodocytophaga aerolata]MDO1446602.1 BlaI/MecI/CopY family transcriptional regulator [Rhodocytophaga aerolata]
MDNQTPKPTESELEILQILWQHGPTTVRFVNEQLNQRKEVGYTTTLKIMQIMAEKGLVKRNEESRSHIYEANVNEEATQKHMLDKFLDLTFRGSASKLVMQALGNHKATRAELDEIRKLIDKMEGGAK